MPRGSLKREAFPVAYYNFKTFSQLVLKIDNCFFRIRTTIVQVDQIARLVDTYTDVRSPTIII